MSEKKHYILNARSNYMHKPTFRRIADQVIEKYDRMVVEFADIDALVEGIRGIISKNMTRDSSSEKITINRNMFGYDITNAIGGTIQVSSIGKTVRHIVVHISLLKVKNNEDVSLRGAVDFTV